MIKQILIILLFAIPVFAQSEQNDKSRENQNVELPEFVITGVERVNLPAVAKPKAELVPMLSESFFKPEIPTEDLQIAELSNPIKKEIKLFDYHSRLNTNLIVGAGLHTLPVGSFYFGKSSAHTLLSGNIWGIAEYPDTTFSAKNNAGLGLNSIFFINNNSSFLPGAKFTLGGGYDRETYKFFASSNSFRRDIHTGNILLSMENLLNNNYKYGFGVKDTVTYLNDTRLTENLYGMNGFLDLFYKDVTFGVKLNLLNQSLNFNSGNNSNRYLDGSVILGIKTPEQLKIKFGFNFASSSNSKPFLLPYGYLAYRFDKFLSAYAEYNPYANFITVSRLLESNRYYNGVPFGTVQKMEGNSTFAIKYEFYTYFEINGGLKYNLYKNYVYFVDSDTSGIFETNLTKARSYGAFVNLLFHLGPFGSFYGGLDFNSLKDMDGFYIPYVSPFDVNLKYSYNFPFGLGIETGLNFYSRRYSDLANNKKIPEFIDLSLKMEYEMFKNFNIFSSLTNILDHKNYIWTGYKLKPYREKPFDIVLGIDYSW